MRWWVLVLALGACDAVYDLRGRGEADAPIPVGDDGAPPDVPPGAHDEDHDGVADMVDTCPGVANANQSDEDGDGVGDACDPFTSKAEPNHRVLFDAFTRIDSQWIDVGEWASDTENVETIASGTEASLTRVSGSIVAGKRWWIDLAVAPSSLDTVSTGTLGIQLLTSTRVVQWTCTLRAELGSWQLSVGSTIAPLPTPAREVLHTAGNGTPDDTNACQALLEGRSIGTSLSLTYPMTIRVSSSVPAHIEFIDVIQ